MDFGLWTLVQLGNINFHFNIIIVILDLSGESIPKKPKDPPIDHGKLYVLYESSFCRVCVFVCLCVCVCVCVFVFVCLCLFVGTHACACVHA